MSFNTDVLLNKRSPLAAVWMASHVERRVAKPVLLKVHIPSSVEAITGGTGGEGRGHEDEAEVEVLALRLSGQLLLGVARIYSRKAKYLMDDCSEALVRIKMAFRSSGTLSGGGGGAFHRAGGRRGAGADVDMPDAEDGGRHNININLNLDGGRDGGRAADFDLLFNADFGGLGMWDDLQALTTPKAGRTKPAGTGRTTVSRHADITLTEDDDFDIDLPDRDPYRTLSERGSPGLPGGEDEQEEAGFGSQEYRALSAELDLGLDLDLNLNLDLDLGLDLGLNDDPANDLDLGLGAREEQPEIDLGSSPSASAQQARAPSRVAAIAAEAREREREKERERSSSEAPSVELGRDAAHPARHARDSIDGDLLPERALEMDLSVLKGSNGADDSGMTDGAPAFVGNDTDMDFAGNGLDDLAIGQRTPRASSPVAPSVLGDQELSTEVNGEASSATQDIDMTPTTANRIAEVAAHDSAVRKRKAAALEGGAAGRTKPAKARKQIVDAVIELEQQRRSGAVAGDSQSTLAGGSQGHSQVVLGGISLASRQERLQQGLIKEPRYLPASALELRLQEIARNPGPHFLGGLLGALAGGENKENVGFYAGPPGLPKQLQGLFRFSRGKDRTLNGNGPAKRVGGAQEQEQRKRARSTAQAQSSPVPSVELGRERQPSLPNGLANEIDGLDFGGAAGLGDGSADFTAGNDFEFDGMDQSLELDLASASRALMDKTPSRLGTPSGGPGHLDTSFNLDFDALDRANRSVLAVFDTASKKSDALSTPVQSRKGPLSVLGTRSTVAHSSVVDDEGDETQQSISVVNSKGEKARSGGWSKNTVKALKVLEHEFSPRDSDKELSFNKLSNMASRKGAAAMFFEMLILGTRDCIKLEQAEAYGDIKIQSKQKLWDVCDGLNKMSVGANMGAGDEQEEGERTPTQNSRVRRDTSVSM